MGVLHVPELSLLASGSRFLRERSSRAVLPLDREEGEYGGQNPYAACFSWKEGQPSAEQTRPFVT